MLLKVPVNNCEIQEAKQCGYTLLTVCLNIARMSLLPILHFLHSSDPKTVNAQKVQSGPKCQVMSLSDDVASSHSFLHTVTWRVVGLTRGGSTVCRGEVPDHLETLWVKKREGVRRMEKI